MKIASPLTAYIGLTLSAIVAIAGCGTNANAQHEFVLKQHLNDPDSAVIRDAFQSAADPEVWCGEVNARNRMGGMVGFTRYVVYMPPKAIVPDVTKDRADAKIFSQVFFEDRDNDSFHGKWALFCRKAK